MSPKRKTTKKRRNTGVSRTKVRFTTKRKTRRRPMTLIEELKKETLTLEQLRKMDALDGNKELVFKRMVNKKIDQARKELIEKVRRAYKYGAESKELDIDSLDDEEVISIINEVLGE